MPAGNSPFWDRSTTPQLLIRCGTAADVRGQKGTTSVHERLLSDRERTRFPSGNGHTLPQRAPICLDGTKFLGGVRTSRGEWHVTARPISAAPEGAGQKMNLQFLARDHSAFRCRPDGGGRLKVKSCLTHVHCLLSQAHRRSSLAHNIHVWKRPDTHKLIAKLSAQPRIRAA